MITLRCGLAAAALLLACVPAVRADDLVERGRALVNGIAACGNCHTPQGPDGPLPGMELAGGTPFVEQAFTAYGSNITPEPETGIGRWSDAQLVRAIRDGVRQDGSLIGPPMPFEFYKGISDSDAAAIVAYLRSVRPVKNLVPRSEYAMPMPASYGPPTGRVPDVPKDDPVRYGAYMAGPLGHCLECHTPMLPGGRRDMARAGAGGQVFRGPWGETVARNITSDPERGLGRWSDAEIKRAVTEGVRPDGTRLGPPMAFHFYKSIDPADLDRLVTFLRTLPPRS
ncbi:c-type cytochrome [Azospirillum thermophilum]|uniref:Cytochrome C n=1 Tax=Azospirillum thermophilum TaxID=2202148 RepID=A0A2S2CSD9_9PROT|nr:cytochrome c [Azospirillum thermophilum]AWK87402.1 cytochrome C [Azospirillum thermophilum]